METTLENVIASPAKPITLIQRLPTEVVSSVLDDLAADEQFGALATIARTSKRMYDLVIPKLYDTIYITETNRLKFTYGGTMADLRVPDGMFSICLDTDEQITSPSPKRSSLGRTRQRPISARSFSRPCPRKTLLDAVLLSGMW
jgi:hypothetical protein